MKIYVASSWKTDTKPVIDALRADGHEVYDFKDSEGFSWSEVDPNWKEWPSNVPAYLKGLVHPAALRGYDRDWTALKSCQACVQVQPCGASAGLELGYAKGAKKLTIVYITAIREPELMLKMADVVTTSLDTVRAVLKARNKKLLQAEIRKENLKNDPTNFELGE